ncbi:MAG: Lrp/AsnC family transcriptional regulator [Candidatus Helarchaeota archaeon]
MGIIQLKKLKEIDKKILRHLLQDSHQPLNKIAEDIGTTRQNISQRIKRLREKEIINSYTITLNYENIEELKVRAYILFREDPNVKIRKENEKILKNIPQVTNFSRLFGKYDGLLEIIAKDNDEVTNIVNKLHTLKGIKETETFIVHTIIKNDKNAPIFNLLE